MPLVAVLGAAGVALVSFRHDRIGQWRVGAFTLLCAFVCSCWAAYGLGFPRRVTGNGLLGSRLDTTGTVVEGRAWGRMYAFAVDTPRGRFVLTQPFDTLPEGAAVRVSGVVRPFRAQGDGFREDRFWYSRGVAARLTSAAAEALPEQHWNIHAWRRHLTRALSVHMPALTGDYLKAAWTGKRDEALLAAHRVWGTSHLLAVSGFHVGIVMMCASCLFRRGVMRVFWLSLTLWAYLLLTGGAPSALRAGLMIQAALLGELAGRPAGALNSVALAAVVLLMGNPYRFWDIGWRLSVLAALTIGAVLERAEPGDWRTWPVLSLLIWLATYPQVARTFGSVPLVGLPLNLIAPPLFAFALTVASAAALLSLAGLLPDLLLEAVDGTFALWAVLADAAAQIMPWQAEWSVWGAWLCTGVLLTLICRSLLVPWRSVAVVVPALGAGAFWLFGG
jgi:competence protein ComEC